MEENICSDPEMPTTPSVTIDRLSSKKVLSFKLSATFLISVSEFSFLFLFYSTFWTQN